MTEAVGDVGVAEWVGSLISEYRERYPTKKILQSPESTHPGNINVPTTVPEDAVLVAPDGEKVFVKAGWDVVIYREYERQSANVSIATIYAPGEQITIRCKTKLKHVRY